ncbi:unnamed protein product [Dracunculus medinensis]|uniref:Transposase n=1 Tax=Dracunculus medinensis TaxID=318479 RepID=A0A0N4U9D2_DRAME|nr:unnamed protein product [Dracunculus medinensis]
MASFDSHDTPRPVVRAIRIQSGCKTVPRFIHKIGSQTGQLLETYQKERLFRGKLLTGVENAYGHSKPSYRLSEVRLLHFGSQLIANLGLKKR